MPSYLVAQDRFGNYDLVHGREWRRHKYIRKEGKRYIYADKSSGRINQFKNKVNRKVNYSDGRNSSGVKYGSAYGSSDLGMDPMELERQERDKKIYDTPLSDERLADYDPKLVEIARGSVTNRNPNSGRNPTFRELINAADEYKYLKAAEQKSEQSKKNQTHTSLVDKGKKIYEKLLSRIDEKKRIKAARTEQRNMYGRILTARDAGKLNPRARYALFKKIPAQVKYVTDVGIKVATHDRRHK